MFNSRMWRGREHDGRIEQNEERQQVKQGQRADQGGVGFEKFPDEALQGVIYQHEIEAVGNDEAIPPNDGDDIERSESTHRRARINLHRMTADSVAEISAPGARRR